MNERVYGTLQASRLFFVRREINELQGEKYFFTKKCISVSNVHFASLLPKFIIIVINVHQLLPIYSMHMLWAILNR